MLDTAVPAEKDVDVTILYQAGRLADITAGEKASLIRRDKNVLRISHLWPPAVEVKAEETPLYINTLKTEKPLEREGLLAVTARTDRKPLVMANLLVMLTDEEPPPQLTPGDGVIHGRTGSQEFIFTTAPGRSWEHGGWTTDALALTSSGGVTLAALCTSLDRDGKAIIRSSESVTVEVRKGKIKFSASRPSLIAIKLDEKPKAVALDGKPAKGYAWDSKNNELKMTLPAGEGTLTLEREF